MSQVNNVQYAYYNQVAAERDISADNFTKGQINFKWENNGHTRFIPSKSYFRIRLQITQNDNTSALYPALNIAPNMFICDNMFQQMKMRINGKIVSSMDDYVPQISALKRRIQDNESKAKKLGKSIEMSHPDYYERLNLICNGINSEHPIHIPSHTPIVVNGSSAHEITFFTAATQVQFFVGGNIAVTVVPDGYRGIDLFSVGEVIHYNDGAHKVARITSITQVNDTAFTLGTTNLVGAAMVALAAANYNGIKIRKISSVSYPLGQCSERHCSFIELIWQPALGFWDINDYICGKFQLELTPVVQSSLVKYCIESIGASKTSADLGFSVVSMLLYTWTGYTNSPLTGSLDYFTQECMMQSQNLTTASLSNKNFTVDPNTFALSIAFQNGGAGDDTRYSRTKFKIGNDEELRLARYYINFKGIMLPRVIPDPQFDIDSYTDYTTQNYYEQLQYSGAIAKSNCESIYDWKARGPFFHYQWPLLENQSSEVTVSTQFNFSSNTAIATYKPQVLLFNHYTYKFTINMKDGIVTSVS